MTIMIESFGGDTELVEAGYLEGMLAEAPPPDPGLAAESRRERRKRLGAKAPP